MEQVMGTVGLVLYLAFMVLAFGVRAVVHRRRTGSTGFNGMRGRPGSAEWFAGVLFVVAVVAELVAPALQAFRAVAPVAVVDGWFARAGASSWPSPGSPRRCGRRKRWVIRGGWVSTRTKPRGLS